MTPFTAWDAGHELTCSACPFTTSGRNGDPACQIALELACVNEPMSAAVCPQPTRSAHSLGIRKRHAQLVRFDAALLDWRSLDQRAATP